MPIFYRQDGISKPPESKPEIKSEILKSTTQGELERLQDELIRAKSIEEKKIIREQILSIKRELSRSKAYTELSRTNALAREKSNDGKESLDSLSASNLMRIDKDETEKNKEKRGNLLSKFFLYTRKTDIEGNIHEEPYNGKDLTKDEELYVDFGKNKSAYNRIGLGHMLSADLGYVKVGGKIGVRSIIQNRVGYYTKPSADGYIPVFTGDVVTIPTASEISTFVNGKEAQGLKRNTDQGESNTANDIYIEKLEQVSAHHTIELNILTKESYDFWVENGFTPAQASGLVANEYQESGCNPRAANGDVSFGIFQWKKDRIANIKAGSGIDILTAGHREQLKAALWEIQNTSESKVLEPLKSAKTSAEAAEIFVRIFERPANPDLESKKRGQMAEVFQYLVQGGAMEGPVYQRIETVAMEAFSNKDTMNAAHCTDWVDKVYLKALGKSVYSGYSYFNGVNKINEGTGLGAERYADSVQLGQINTGFHLIFDKPPYKSGKTHSAIALGKANDGLLKVVSYPGIGVPKVEIYDLYAQGRGDKDGKAIRIQGA